jgi:hypothetical protein
VYCDHQAGCKPVEIEDINYIIYGSPCSVIVSVGLSPTNSNYAPEVTWIWTGGGYGYAWEGGYFINFYDMCVSRTVTATCCSSSKSIQPAISCPAGEHCCTGSCFCCPDGQTCCPRSDGTKNCCDPNLCQSCVDSQCKECGGDPNKTCCNGSCCDHTQCQDCNATTHACEVCGGDPNKKCCDGSCTKKCELEGNTTQCTGETQMCPGCNVYCEDYYKINWTGNSIYSCKEPGCPGDCQDAPEVVCYRKTQCNQMIVGKSECWFGTCMPSISWGSGCVQCTHIQYPTQDVNVPSKKCGQ